MRLWVRLTFLSDFWVRLTFGQTYPRIRLQVRLTFLSDLQVRLTFAQMYSQDQTMGQVDIYVRSSGKGQADLWSDVPPDQALGQGDIFVRSSEHLVAKCVTTSVRLISGQMYLPRMRLWVRLTFSYTLGQADLWFFFP